MDTCVYANNMQLHFEIHEVPRLEHLVYDCAPRLSPLPASTYADEDMVGKIKQFALKSHPFRLGYQILQRYAAYCCCRWLRQLTGWFDGKFVWLYMLKKKDMTWPLLLVTSPNGPLAHLLLLSLTLWSKGNGHQSVMGWERTIWIYLVHFILCWTKILPKSKRDLQKTTLFCKKEGVSKKQPS